MNTDDLVWAVLPDGLQDRFLIHSFVKTDSTFMITLIEKNVIPTDLPTVFRGKKIINNVLKSKTIRDFNLRNRKTDIILKRRYWKFEGMEEMYARPINICADGTNLGKEFADFLKELRREYGYEYDPNCPSE